MLDLSCLVFRIQDFFFGRMLEFWSLQLPALLGLCLQLPVRNLPVMYEYNLSSSIF
jgi:hypothetical protein